MKVLWGKHLKKDDQRSVVLRGSQLSGNKAETSISREVAGLSVAKNLVEIHGK